MLFTNNRVHALECDKNTYVNIHGVEMTCEQLNNLQNLGFNEKEIMHMDQEEFDANKYLFGEVVAETVKYYKTTTYYPNNSNLLSINNSEPISVSEEINFEEYEQGNNIVEIKPNGLSNGYTETTYKRMTTTIINLGSNYRYKNTVNWKQEPTVKNYDIIGIGIEQSKVYGISSTKYIKSLYSYNTNNACYDTTTTSGTWTLGADGYSVKFKVPYTSNYGTFGELYAYMYFNVDKSSSNTINVLNAYGNYRHATSNFTNTTFSFSITALGIISIGGSYDNKYDSISTAQATWTGLNW